MLSSAKKTLKTILEHSGIEIKRTHKKTKYPIDFDDNTIRIIDEVKPYTMTSPERICSLIEAVKYIVRKNIEGDIVECGVWRGGSAMAVLETLKYSGDVNRKIFLYDTFDGMSEPTEDDREFSGAKASDILSNSNKEEDEYGWCFATLEDVKNNISKCFYPMESISFVKGKVEDTIPGVLPEKISILRLDTDWYESTKHELNHLFPLLVPGGVLIIDDYGHWVGARKAVDEYIQENNIKLLLNRIDYTGRIGIKL